MDGILLQYVAPTRLGIDGMTTQKKYMPDIGHKKSLIDMFMTSCNYNNNMISHR